MLNSAMLKVSCAMASDSPSATLTAGMTGMNRCTASGPTNEIEASANAKSGPGVAFMKGLHVAGGRSQARGRGRIYTPFWRVSEQVLDGTVGLVDRGVRIGGSAGVGIGDGDAAEAGAADDMRRLPVGPVRIEQRIIFVGVTVRPAVDRDGGNVAGRIETAGTEDARQLVADVALEGLEARGVDVALACAMLVELRQPGLRRRAHHVHQDRLVRR